MREKLIKEIHIAKKELGLNEQDYRSVIRGNANGKESCADCSEVELIAVKKAFERMGWVKTIKKGDKRKKVDLSGIQKKIFQLWYQLRDLGACSGTTKGLNSWLLRSVGVDAIEFVNQKLGNKAIEMLKAWLDRVECEKMSGREADAK